MRSILSGFICFLTILFLMGCGPGEESPLYKIELKDWEGNTHAFAKDKGKLIVLDFWASWCEPCKKAVPVVEALRKELKDSDAIVLGVNTEDDLSLEEIKKAAKEFGMDYPSLLDPEWKLVNSLKIEGQPALFVFSKTGKKLHFQYGISHKDLPLLKGRLKNWLESP
ncbi:TlpA family protein disulfide reductase [Leptospira wolffii]|uniref:TlpA family protein disulfide reductase n=1 Tax=Leptospira wolffii TaxID=409998 RepID=UPI001083F0C2|nr:TlpA disulfide reductase family protein [Leptospira wolffii]TGK59990.1 TlpA family protein disulfide reductase [Leptospira wolffii]TGK70020.1 TlpA family protein disulfide reductase [Leptospira wolffii]TGK75998.1 TlpA family protein disulfide reductase [Leptospira wolffii]TGL30249.1 TlpA family protein disulfide reductase [Leptospira wolffii]